MATAKVMPKKVQLSGTTEVKCSNSSPNHPVKGPGKTGKKEPITPSNTKTSPNSNKKRSIVCFL